MREYLKFKKESPSKINRQFLLLGIFFIAIPDMVWNIVIILIDKGLIDPAYGWSALYMMPILFFGFLFAACSIVALPLALWRSRAKGKQLLFGLILILVFLIYLSIIVFDLITGGSHLLLR